MNSLAKIVFLSLLFLIASCNTKPNAGTDGDTDNTESIDGDSDEQELVDDGLGDEVQMDSEPSETDDGELGSLKTYTLKWKDVHFDEFGIMYTFENKNGEEVVFTQLADPDFNESDYYTSTAVKDRIFPIIEIREDVKERWFEVVTEIQEMENVNEPNEPYRAPVIISIKPI